MTCGLPWPAGRLGDPTALALLDPDGERRPLQARALDRWPDGSVRWVLLDWLADCDVEAAYRLFQTDESGQPAASAEVRAAVDAASGAVEVVTGAMSLTLGGGERFPFARVEHGGAELVDPRRGGLVVEDRGGRAYGVAVEHAAVEEPGPVRACVRLDGRLRGPSGEPGVEVVTRLHCFAGSPVVRVELTLRNPRAAAHPGGRWSLGSSGSIFLRRASLRVALPAADPRPSIRLSTEIGAPYETMAGPVELHQESSGGANWDSRNHVNRDGVVPLRFRGYRLQAAGDSSQGQRATPAMALRGEGSEIALAMRHFWQEFPKAIEAGDGILALELFPRQHGDLHELQGGEQKTHRFHLALGRDGVGEEPLDWARSPLFVAATPDWYAASGAIPRLVTAADDGNRDYQALVRSAVEGDDSFYVKRERLDEYGWRHFGDIYGDHEAVFDGGETPLVSHYNNQFDAVWGFGLQFLRTGDPRWLRFMEELAWHVVDIDTYHTDEDKAAYNRGQFWHTVHYVDAGTSTHRTYPPSEGVGGGGPSPGQLYSSGLMLHHFLSGSLASRELAIQYGQYVIDADDGRKTIFRFVDPSDTGHVSESGFDRYHGPGRTPANAVNALLDAHRLTGEKRFLDKAEQLVRRCIHPLDDLEERNLLDAENRWYYTMFLQSLGKYLEHKLEIGERDRRYAYAHAAYLHYARWAAENEYPYLDKPEILEYPTETWAAQDMRKCEVLNFAALLSEGAERDRFLERGRFFFDTSVVTLAGMETRTLCRPVVILLTNGASQGWFDSCPAMSLPAPRDTGLELGDPVRFESQKRRVVRKLRRWAVLAAAAAAAAALALLWALL